MEFSLFDPRYPIVSIVWSLKCGLVLRSCLSYDRHRDRINLVLLHSWDKWGGRGVHHKG